MTSILMTIGSDMLRDQMKRKWGREERKNETFPFFFYLFCFFLIFASVYGNCSYQMPRSPEWNDMMLEKIRDCNKIHAQQVF